MRPLLIILYTINGLLVIIKTTVYTPPFGRPVIQGCFKTVGIGFVKIVKSENQFIEIQSIYKYCAIDFIRNGPIENSPGNTTVFDSFGVIAA